MNSRLASLRSSLVKHKLSHILITDPVDVTYISGFSSTNAALLIGRRSNRILTDFRYVTAVTNFCLVNPEWKYSIIKTCMAETIASLLTPESRVGYQSDTFTVDEYKKLRRHAAGTKLLSVGTLVQELVAIKEPFEISLMEQAAAIGDQAFTRILGTLATGISEKECACQLERYCTDLGSQKPSFDTIVLFGENAALPHGRPGERTLKKGDVVLIDFGCTVDGFASDMTRTVFKGKATSRQRELYGAVLDAQHHACSHAHAGMRGRDIDALARTIIDKRGYKKEFGHALGHGVGRRIHAAPRVSANTRDRLGVNCVFTIEPGIYLPGFGGIRIEDMAVLEQKSVRLLTHAPKELIEV